MKFYNVMHPPTSQFLLEYLCNGIENAQYGDLNEANRFKRLSMHMLKNKPDKEWMLGILGILDPDNAIFKKGYKPPGKNPVLQKQEEQFPVRPGFFDGLEVLNPKQMRVKSSISFMTKKQRLEL